MSNIALNWAFATPLPKAVDKLLLVCLANYADDFGFCFPSQAKIVSDTSLDRKTVIAGLRRLIGGGLVMDTGERRGATHQVAVYRLAIQAAQTIPNTAPLQEAETVPSFPVKGPVFPTEESRISRERVPQTGHGTTREPSVEPSGEPPALVGGLVSKDLFGSVPIDPPAAVGNAKPVKPKRSVATGETPEFQAFWSAYPRKDAKGGPRGAVGAWATAVKLASPAEIMAGLARYRFSAEAQYRPLASTWLNQQRWRNEADTAPMATVAPVADRRMQAVAMILGRPVPGFGLPEARGSPHPFAPDAPTIDLDDGDWREH